MISGVYKKHIMICLQVSSVMVIILLLKMDMLYIAIA